MLTEGLWEEKRDEVRAARARRRRLGSRPGFWELGAGLRAGFSPLELRRLLLSGDVVVLRCPGEGSGLGCRSRPWPCLSGCR